MHPKAVLDTGAELVRQCLVFDHPADATVARFFREHRHLGPRERATLSGMVYAVLRQKLLFEHFAPSGSGPRERRMAILGLAHHQRELSATAGAEQVRAAQDFLQASLSDQERLWLSQCQAISVEDLLDRHRHNLPDWLVSSLQEELGSEFWPLVASLSQTAPLDLRVNIANAKPSDLQKELAAAGVTARPTPYSPWGLRVEGKPSLTRLKAFERGDMEVQDEGSQLLALLLDAKRGEMVVDFCAGAGGKTLALGAAMRNTGRLYAFDTSAHRLDALKPRLARSGLSNVHPAALAHERDDRIKRLAGKIDRVLVDAPCSGLGTLRRHPDLKWRQTPRSIAALTQSQASILDSAARLVKPGGRLVYATCSLLAAENEAQAQAFNVRHADFQQLEVGGLLEQLKVSHGQSLCNGPYLRLWPHRHSTDGFFAAVWERS
jgi:16S rRNA (cytosine967-C5)-methyltransferase